MKEKKLHFAWFVLAGTVLIRGFAGGGINMTSSLFLNPVSQDLGVGVGTLSVYFSITSVVMVLWLPFAGKLLHKYDVRLVALMGAVLQILSFVAFGFMNQVYGWYLLAIPYAMGSSIIVNLLGPILINRWFAKHEGLILGIQMAFVGIFGAILQPYTSHLIAGQGWRSAYFIVGGLSFVVVALAALLLLRNKPEDMHLIAYGKNDAPAQEAQKKQRDHAVEISEKTAVRSASFYLLLLFMVAITGVGVFTQHIPTYGSLLGYTVQNTGVALACASIGSAIGSIIIGIVCDKIGSLKTCYGIIVLEIIAVGGFFISGANFALFGASSFVHGLVSSSIMILGPILTLEFYGQLDYEKIYAKVSMGAPLASILLIPAYGFIYDLMKNYTLVLIAMFGLLILAALCIAVGWRKRCTIDGCPGWWEK